LPQTDGTGSTTPPPTYDFFAIGEVVVDFISTEVAASLANANTFTRFVGGQAANLAINMARLGNRSAVAACVGYDGFGKFVRDQIDLAGVNTFFIQTTREAPTSTAVITRQTQTPDFIIHRGADAYLRSTNELSDAVANSSLVHTSAFALSREPARTTILTALNTAKAAGRTITLDPNFDANIWPDRADFLEVLKETFKIVDITKPSLEDCTRLFGPRNTPAEFAQIYLDWGAALVLISMGEQGIYLACSSGEEYQIHANKELVVQDVTGAGDAYWAGFLTAQLHRLTPIEAATIGQGFAEEKISHFGPIINVPSWNELRDRAKEIEFSLLSTVSSQLKDKGGD
jgi:fructokinase